MREISPTATHIILFQLLFYLFEAGINTDVFSNVSFIVSLSQRNSKSYYLHLAIPSATMHPHTFGVRLLSIDTAVKRPGLGTKAEAKSVQVATLQVWSKVEGRGW